LKELPDAREKWQGVKDLKREPQPQFIRLRDLNGELVAPKDRAETIATYLEQKHWNNPSEHTMPRSDALQRLQDQFDVGQFTLLEFDQALKTTKNNKQAGPDGIAMELFKWMDAENRFFSSISLIIGGVTSRRPKAFFVLGLCQSLRRVTRIFPKTTALSLC
jgi:hypothetical protein